MGYGIFFLSLALGFTFSFFAFYLSGSQVYPWEYGLVALFWGIWLGYTGYNLIEKKAVDE